jgi:hypothetical protein
MTILLVLVLIRESSSRVLTVAQPPAERLVLRDPIPPGSPPVLAFRYLEGKQRGRFSGIDLVLDDAGH